MAIHGHFLTGEREREMLLYSEAKEREEREMLLYSEAEESVTA